MNGRCSASASGGEWGRLGQRREPFDVAIGLRSLWPVVRPVLDVVDEPASHLEERDLVSSRKVGISRLVEPRECGCGLAEISRPRRTPKRFHHALGHHYLLCDKVDV